MCVVSMVMDHYIDRWKLYVPPNTNTNIDPNISIATPITAAEIAEFRTLLERAREYDRKHNEPACELQEKRDLLKRLAQALGVEIDFV